MGVGSVLGGCREDSGWVLGDWMGAVCVCVCVRVCVGGWVFVGCCVLSGWVLGACAVGVGWISDGCVVGAWWAGGGQVLAGILGGHWVCACW